ncbi:MAG: aminotransferase class I/II-fold pyridoxal phosphate-dependent enzyme [Methanomassiliicoccales archaeon]
MRATRRALDINYAIADILFPARELEKKGVEVTKLYIGDPNKFDYRTPKVMRDALCRAAERCDHGYADSEGAMELREAVVEKERRKNRLSIDGEDVYITTGVTESLQMIMASLLDPGDEFLLPGPGYPPYDLFIHYFRGKAVPYRTDEDNDWQPDLDDLRAKITSRTRGISVINPNNPTGTVYSRSTLQEMVDIAGEHDLPLITDEIYDLMTFEGEHHSPATMAGDVPVIIFNGMSKSFLVPGWRVGYMAFVDGTGALDQVKDGVLRQLGLRISANHPCQLASAETLRGPWDFLGELREKLKRRSDFAHRRLNEIPGISTTRPRAAFYIFPRVEGGPWRSDKEFVLDALENAHVLLVPGDGFCSQYGTGHFRSVTLPDEETMGKALDSFEDFMRKRVE